MAGREVPGHAGLLRWDTIRPSRRPGWATWRTAVVVVVVAACAALVVAHVRHDGTIPLAVDGPVDRVSVVVDAGSVHISGGPEPGARVLSRRRGLLGSPSPTTQAVADGVLRVVGLCPGGLVLRCRTDIRVQVPATALVEVTTGSADVTVEGMARSVQATSRSGSFTFRRLAGPALDVRTASGGVRGAEVGATQVAVVARRDVTLGLTNVADSLLVRTTKGAVDLTVPDAAYRVTTDSAIGEVAVELTKDPDARRTITVTAPEGDIHLRRAS